ncbi:hypothetical protein PA598K_02349 [Paenibacillus sp. 598K]|uniref:hypothetical protein n=1 Tax=Paenibacillus sp. 598K TaxID=1117987 RepID=UPI000FF9F359|nr:hypothetical protein [Paenibacillus sp. 598K]GBF74019.1 hypothetical protein PA598K_02349 [Paenibacillus sp. 598K]
MNEKTVYIILSDTGTLLSRMIRLYTRAELNHASLAFDAQLNEVYSFGRKRPGNPFIGGFVKESLGDGLLSQGACAVYSCDVSERDYERIRAYVRRFEADPDRYRYNLLGLFGVMMRVRVRRQHAYFCSQFVASAFEASGRRLVPQCASLTTPADLERSPSLQLMFRGELSRFEAM